MALTSEQKAVQDASRESQDAMRELDGNQAKELEGQYGKTVDDIAELLLAAAGAAGIVSLAAMPYVLHQIRVRLAGLGAERDALLERGIARAAELGAQPFRSRLPAAQLDAVRAEAAQYVRSFTGTDQLKLSDRIWRIDRHAQEIVSQSVQNAVLRGDGAMRATQEFLARGIAAPADIGLARSAATPGAISGAVEQGLFTGRGTPFDNTLRVMRTEINRAHTRAYQQSVASDMEAIGTRFMLSPRHPRVDICDMHARANLFGLGPGVYPKGRSPLPAHPNTLSFEVVVYRDEISQQDRAGKQSVVQFLETVPSKDRAQILGVNKNESFEAGDLPASQVRSKWSTVQRRLNRRSS